MARLPRIRLMVLAFVIAALSSGLMLAQDDPNDIPLGDVARNLRKKNPPAKPVIDDDNLPQLMERADAGQRAGLRYLMAGETGGFQLAAPDVTCSLSFTANVKSLLTGQYAQMDLPSEEMAKLQGQAIIEGDSLTIPIFNGTNWHVSELAVALTVIRKRGEPAFSGAVYRTDGSVDVSQGDLSAQSDPLEQVRSEKKPDLTVIYRMRTGAPPWERAVFSAHLKVELGSGDEWHWALVRAKGYPPESYAAPPPKTADAKGRFKSRCPSAWPTRKILWRLPHNIASVHSYCLLASYSTNLGSQTCNRAFSREIQADAKLEPIPAN